MNTIISPSILSCDFVNIERDLKIFEGQKDLWIHLDIMDGHFVPNLTFGPPIIKRISQITNLPLDAHLMVNNPEFHLEVMKDFGLKNFTFHYEAVSNPLELVQKIKSYGINAGISIKPGTSENVLEDSLLQALDLILIMSVEPGFGGQSFMPNSLEKTKNLVKKRSELQASFQIQIDGGINKDTGSLAKEAGADNMVAGSYIFKEENRDFIARVNSLR